MITRYFKVIVAKNLPINFSIQDLRKAPHSYFEMKEYSEHIVEVTYQLDPSANPDEFEKLIKKAIKGNYSNIHSIQEGKK